MTIGEQLRKLRKEQGLTAKQLSERSGVPEKTIYRIETEEVADPKLSSIKPLVFALGCSFDELLKNKREIGLSGELQQLLIKTNELPTMEKALLIKMISRWINSVYVEEMYKKTMNPEDAKTWEMINKKEEEEFDEMVHKEREEESIEEYLTSLEK